MCEHQAQAWKWGTQLCGNRWSYREQGALLSMRLYPSWMESLWEDEPRPCADLPGAGMRYNGWEPLKHSQGSL